MRARLADRLDEVLEGAVIFAFAAIGQTEVVVEAAVVRRQLECLLIPLDRVLYSPER